MQKDIKEILLTKEEIDEIIKKLGEEITNDYKEKDLLLITILKGAVVFLSDVLREIKCHCEIDFMVVSSYGASTQSSGNVKIIKDIDINLENKDVLIIEDILDSGNTLSSIVEILKTRNPKSIEICTFLDKPTRRLKPVAAKYIGKEIPDEFVVGYGLDFSEKYRNLPFVGVLDPKAYS